MCLKNKNLPSLIYYHSSWYALYMEHGRIPNRLRKYRRLAGFSQRQTAQLLHMHNASSLSRWEKGLSMPKLKYLFQLSLLYRTHPIHLYQEFWQYLKKDLSEKESNLLAHHEPISSNDIDVL